MVTTTLDALVTLALWMVTTLDALVTLALGTVTTLGCPPCGLRPPLDGVLRCC
jgi:hypothetical protein